VPLVKNTRYQTKMANMQKTEFYRFDFNKCGFSYKKKTEIAADNYTVHDGEFPWMVSTQIFI
jgi:hypothetical protein